MDDCIKSLQIFDPHPANIRSDTFRYACRLATIQPSFTIKAGIQADNVVSTLDESGGKDAPNIAIGPGYRDLHDTL
jgi:hypothetical protein